jgi:hypothetical protein
MLPVNGHAQHRRSLCRVGYGKAALSMDPQKNNEKEMFRYAQHELC